jgi:thymidylate kinase
MFISIDGPSGAGKSTIVRHLAQLLVAAGENVHITACYPTFVLSVTVPVSVILGERGWVV